MREQEIIYKQLHCFPFLGFRASAELAKGSARTTQLVSPVLQRKDIDVCVLQSLRANTAKKVTMALTYSYARVNFHLA